MKVCVHASMVAYRSEQVTALDYTQLDKAKKSIRLLEEIPDDFEDDIVCQLHRVDLDDDLVYTGLSYMLNHDGDYATITCEESSTQIGKNLWHFLLQYRSWLRQKNQRLWVDALCTQARLSDL